MSNRGKLLAGVSVGALVAAPEAALAMGGPKWGAHVELGGKFSEDRQIGSADFFMPLWQDQFSLLFADVRGRFDNNESLEGNFGLGYRRQVNKDWIVGGYAFYDIKESEFDNKFNQLTAGFEAMSEDWEFRINGYLPEDDVKPVSGAGGGGGTSSVRITGTTIQLVTPGIGSAEQAFYGGDVEVGFKVPLFDHNDDGKELRVFAGGFHFDSDMAAKEIAGPRGRAELRMFDVLGTGSRFVLGGEVQRDDIRGTEAYGTVQIRVPLQSTKAKRLTGLDRRMLNTVQRDVDIVTNLIPGVDEIIEDVIIDFQGVGTDTIVFADKYGNPGGPGTVNDPTTLGQAQYALGKDADNNRIFPGIIVINDDDDGALSGTNGIQLRPNQALIGGGLPVVLTGAETGRQVAHAFGGDTNENGTLLLAANEGRFIRLANNNEVGGFSIYGDSYNGKGASHTGIHGGEGVNQAFIRDMNIYNMGTAGISIENFNNEDRNIRIDNLLVDVDKYSNVDNRRNLGRGVSIGFYAGSDVLAADDGIVDIDVSITNSTIFSGGENPGISVDVEANEGSVTTNIAITDNSVTNVGYDTEEEYNGYTYIYSVRDDAIEIDQFLSGGGTARFNTLVANNTIGGGRRGIDIDGYVGPGTELVHNVRVEDNTLYGLKSGVAIGTGVKSFGGYGDSAKQIFGNANYTVKGAPQTQISGTVNVADNIMARPNYGAGPNNIYGAGISVRNSFYGAVVSGTAQAAGQVINITDNNLVGVRGQLVSVQTGVGSHNLQALEHGANQQYQTPRVNDDAISFVNQEITVSDNSNTYVPNKHGAPDGEVSFGGIQVSTNVYGGINKDADSGLGNGLELVDVRQDITVTNNDVENVIAPPDYYGSYQYYGPFNAGNNIPFDIGQIRIIGLPSSGRSVGIQVAGFASESNQPGGEPQQVSLAQSLNVSGNTVNDLRAFPGYYGYGYGQMDVSTGMDDPGTGRGIEVVAEASGGAAVFQAGEVSGNSVENIFGRGINVGAYTDEFKANDDRPSYVSQKLNLNDNQIDNVFGVSFVPDDPSQFGDAQLSAGIALQTHAGSGEGEGEGDVVTAVYQSINIGGEAGTNISGASDTGIASINVVEDPGLGIDRRLNISNTNIDGLLAGEGDATYCPDYGCTDTGIGVLDAVTTLADNARLNGQTVVTGSDISNVTGGGIYSGSYFAGGRDNTQSLQVTNSVVQGGVVPNPGPAAVSDQGPLGEGSGITVVTYATNKARVTSQQATVSNSLISGFTDAGVEVGLNAFGDSIISSQQITISGNNGGIGETGYGIYDIEGGGISIHAMAGEGGRFGTRTTTITGNSIGYTGLLGVFDSVVSVGAGRIGTTNTTIMSNTINNTDGFGVLLHASTEAMNGANRYHNVTIDNNIISNINNFSGDDDGFQPGYHIEDHLGPTVDYFSGKSSGLRGGTGIAALQTFYGSNTAKGSANFYQTVNSYGNDISQFAGHGTFLGQRAAVARDNSALPATSPFDFEQRFVAGSGESANSVATNVNESGFDVSAVQYGNGTQTGNVVESQTYSCYQTNDGNGVQDVCNVNE